MTRKTLSVAACLGALALLSSCEDASTVVNSSVRMEDTDSNLNQQSKVVSSDDVRAKANAAGTKTDKAESKPKANPAYDPLKYAQEPWADILPTAAPNAKAFISSPIKEGEDGVILKHADFVPNEDISLGFKGVDVPVEMESCKGKGSKSVFCKDGYLLLLQNSTSRVKLADGGFVVFTISLNYEPWYEVNMTYVKDGIAYPTPWFFTRDDHLFIDQTTDKHGDYVEPKAGPYYGQVDGDICVYAHAKYGIKDLSTQYNCFNVNPDYEDKKGSAPKLILTKQTAKHGLITMEADKIDNSNLKQFASVAFGYYDPFMEMANDN